MKRISIKGVAIGNIVDIVSTNLILFPLILYLVASSRTGSPPDHATGSSTEILEGSTAFTFASSILGGLSSVLGGYVSARLAKHNEMLNGALSSIICVCISLYALISGRAVGHLWLYLVFLPLSPALGAFGGFLRLRQKARHS
jgi:hypothetical protein